MVLLDMVRGCVRGCVELCWHFLLHVNEVHQCVHNVTHTSAKTAYYIGDRRKALDETRQLIASN